MKFLRVSRVGNGLDIPEYLDREEMQNILAHLSVLKGVSILDTIPGSQEALADTGVQDFEGQDFWSIAQWMHTHRAFIRTAWATRIEEANDTDTDVQAVQEMVRQTGVL